MLLQVKPNVLKLLHNYLIRYVNTLIKFIGTIKIHNYLSYIQVDGEIIKLTHVK